jgi:hypothetical protein
MSNGYATFTLAEGTSDWLMNQITDPNGFATSYLYDQQRRVFSRSVAAIRPVGGAGRTTYLYQPGGCPQGDLAPPVSQMRPRNGRP